MLKWILFETTTFAPGEDHAEGQKDVMWYLEALTQRNQDYLVQHPGTPPLYRSGVVYKLPLQFGGDCEEVAALRKALGSSARSVGGILDRIQAVFAGERFRDIGVVLENGGGDCDNLGAWRAAELRQRGIPARCYMTNRKQWDGSTIYHVLVLWPDGTSEDPSLLLGMGGKDRTAERAEEIRKNAERCDNLRRGLPPAGAGTGCPGSPWQGGGQPFGQPLPSDVVNEINALIGKTKQSA